MEQISPRYCRRCLLRDMSEDMLFQSIQTYIDRIPPERKAHRSVVEKRLALCRECDELISGMCRLCGCYVELRAVMKIRGCPRVPARWHREEEGEAE